MKDNWFGKCTLCGMEKQLSTVQITGHKTYSLTLRRMCDKCRYKTLFHFYTGLGFKDTAKIWRKKID